MRSPDRQYRCVVCKFQGPLEPVDAGDAAPCPNCGVYLYPLTWAQTWGVALAIIAGTVLLIAAVTQSF